MTAVLQTFAILLCVAGATAVVFARDPKRQIFVYSIYGLLLSVLFAVLQAPDVALSEMAVGSIAIPFAILATVVRIEHGPK